MAMESDNMDQVAAIKDVLSACINTERVDRLSTFDIEYLFLHVRGKSIGETIEVMQLALTMVTKVPITGIDEIQVKTNPEHNKISN